MQYTHTHTHMQLFRFKICGENENAWEKLLVIEELDGINGHNNGIWFNQFDRQTFSIVASVACKDPPQMAMFFFFGVWCGVWRNGWGRW